MFLAVAMKSKAFSSFSYSAVQELGGSTARQLAQAGQWKYSTTWTSCSVYEWGLAGKPAALLVSMSLNPLLSGSSNFFRNLAKFANLAFHRH